MLFDAQAPPSATAAAANTLERYFQVSLYLLMAAGFASVDSTGKLDGPSLLLMGAALTTRGYLLARGRQFLFSERMTSLLTLIYVGFYSADIFLLSRNFVSATVHLVLFAAAVKMFSVRRERDYVYLAVLSFLMVLAAAVLTVDSIFLAGFTLFMLVAVTTFILMEMRRSAALAVVRAREDDTPAAQQKMGYWLAACGPLFVTFILLTGTAIFFLIPRVSAGYLGAYAPGTEFATGFSENVRLGQIGIIQQSDSLVMHIQIEGAPGDASEMKWRGLSLGLFDGRGWSNPLAQIEAPRVNDGRFLLPTAPEERGARLPSRPVRYRVIMEPIGTNVFFLAPKAVSVGGPYRQIAIDGGGAVFNADRERAITSYDGVSELAQPPAALLRATSGNYYPASIALRYLQLPKVDARVHDLARQVTNTASNDYDKAVSIEQYLRTQLGYTLELPRTIPRDPIADFLFVRKQGHCEYFASAMAVMLRTLGIPSRIVNGFRGAEYNDLTGSYLVRARNAHSWVEAYFPGQGWVTFDPTPAGDAQAHIGWHRLWLYMDAAAQFWREWVVNYDFGHQHTLAQQSTRSGRAVWESSREWLGARYARLLELAREVQDSVRLSPGRWAGYGMGAMAALLLALNGGWLWKRLQYRRVARRPERSPHLAASIWYERLIRALSRRGWQKSPMQTPHEFATTIEDFRVRRRVTQFTDHYERARFAESAEDAKKLPELFEEVTSGGKSGD
ncbi:MAG TPA: DUF3488 and transglutaminase-like domain-containing protein [Terriglobales bacterium]|nr:DUF3488 and transglutaminase-like domain-containing protein [Terriglobales bacterium]